MFKSQREDYRILYIIVVGLTILTLIVAVALWTQSIQRNAQNELIKALELEHDLDIFYTYIQDIEAGQRGYLLTEDTTYLQKYKSGLSKVDSSLSQVIEKLKENNIAPSRIQTLSKRVEEKKENLKLSIQQMGKDGNNAIVKFEKEGYGRSLTEVIRREVGLIYEEQNDLIALRREQDTKYLMLSRVFTIIGTIILFGIATLVYTIVRPLVHQLVESRNKEQANNKLLAEKNEELEHFAFIASHDLKEPLRSIRGFIGALKEDYGDQLDEEGQQYISFIEKAGSRMSNLVDGLLTFSRLGRASSPSSVNLNSILKGIVKDLEFLINENEAKIVFEKLPTIVCMKIEIRQLIQNLIHNGIKFSAIDRNPIITITAKEHSEEWEFSVKDNGIGIEGKNRVEIFKMLTKVHHQSEYEGQGLGLAFCKKIVEQHQGRIWVESESGVGSDFKFTISKNLKQEKN